MNTENVIITPEVAHLIARRVFAASRDNTLNRDLPSRFLRELKTALRDEIAAGSAASVGSAMAEFIYQLTAMRFGGRDPFVDETPIPEFTDVIVAYCAEAPRTLRELHCRIHYFGSIGDHRMTAMVREWERQGLIRNSGTAIRHRWVPGSRFAPLLAPREPPQVSTSTHRDERTA